MWCACVLLYREGGSVGDASIRKIAYFDGAKDPSLFKGNVRFIVYICHYIPLHYVMY